MAAAEIDALKKMRNRLTTVRRQLVVKATAPSGSEDPDLLIAAEQLAKLQAGIEAVGRAIRDEGGLPPGASTTLSPSTHSQSRG